jgi:hypothetical protein
MNAVLVVVLALTAALLAPAGSFAWAPAKSATIHPGVQVFTESAQCTSNFVFEEGSSVYLGQAAHCSGTGGPMAAAAARCRSARRWK